MLRLPLCLTLNSRSSSSRWKRTVKNHLTKWRGSGRNGGTPPGETGGPRAIGGTLLRATGRAMKARARMPHSRRHRPRQIPSRKSDCSPSANVENKTMKASPIFLPGRPDRRRFLRQVGISSILFTVPGAFAELVRTPKQTEGPFYPDKLPLDTDNDLLIVNDA